MPETNWEQLHGTRFAGSRVLVTGGAGFIGSHLSESLLRLGARVVVLDNLSTGRRENLRQIDGAELIEGSILDADAVAHAMHGARYVFHQAAAVSVSRSVEEPLLFHDINGRGTLNVLEAARAAGVSRVVFAASSSAYGDSEALPKLETMQSLPKSPYAATKLYGEALMRAYSRSYGLDTASLRYFNIFGPRQTPDSAYAAAIAAFAKAMIAGKRPTIYGDGEQSRDFTFVHNAVHANLLAARQDRPVRGQVFNVGCGQRVSLNVLVRLMAEILGTPELSPTYGPERPGDVKHSLADITRARELLGYAPIVDFREGLAATTAWYREALG
ncbi:MAG: SDR family oxidoreductase [Planctomycetota bacterium]|nr:SDR family oxidoreductase [Planctomycetota bacterium]